jgi:hypothetical protein
MFLLRTEEEKQRRAMEDEADGQDPLSRKSQFFSDKARQIREATWDRLRGKNA